MNTENKMQGLCVYSEETVKSNLRFHTWIYSGSQAQIGANPFLVPPRNVSLMQAELSYY